MPIIDIEVDGLQGLFGEVLKIADSLPDQSFLWFRGLPTGRYKLLPSLMRDDRSPEDVFEREARLVTRFRQRSLAYWPAGYPQTDWEHLFAMQHFGIPTRLLDWTENLFVAAYFCVLATTQSSDDGDYPVVWCFDPVEWNRATPALSEFGKSVQVLTTSDEDVDPYRPDTNKKRKKTPVALYGAHNSNRIAAQRGTFMIWGSDARPLEAFAGEIEARIWKLTVVGDRLRLSKSLSQLGFRETMIFPELPALARELTGQEGWRA